MLKHIFKFTSIAAIAGASMLSIAPQEAAAQMSSECSAIGNFFDQSVGPGGMGTTRSASYYLEAGDEIVGTITNASNSLLDIFPGMTLFSGDTGTKTASFTAPNSGFYSIAADIQAGMSSGASITVICIPVAGVPLVIVLPGPGSGPLPLMNQDLDAATQSSLDAVDAGRPRPGGPGFNTPDTNNLDPIFTDGFESGNTSAWTETGTRNNNSNLFSFAGTSENRLTFSSQGIEIGDGQSWLWTDLNVGFLTGSSSRDGYVANLRLGAVRAVTDTLDFGFYGSYLMADTDMITPTTVTNLESTGYGAGAYVKFAVGENTWGSLALFAERSVNDVNISGVVSSFERTYATLDGTIARQFQTANGTNITPLFGVGLISSSREAYFDSAANFFAKDDDLYVTAQAGVDVSQTFPSQLSWANQVTVLGGATLNYEDRPSRTFANGQSLTTGDLTGALRAGAKFSLNSGAAFDLRLGANGLGGSTQSISGTFEWRKDF